MQGDTDVEQGTSPGDGAQGLSTRGWIAQAWGTTSGRRVIVWAAVVLVLLLALGAGIAMFASLSGESQSYKDGYSAGGSVFAADASQASPDQACRETALRGAHLGGTPAGDSSDKWIQGCVAGFESAQSGN